MKIRCKFCGDIIEGDKKGKYITCKCKSCYIDETNHYCRIGGNFIDIEAVIDFTEYNDLTIKASSREEVVNKYENNWNELKDWLSDNLYILNEILDLDAFEEQRLMDYRNVMNKIKEIESRK